MTLEGRIKALVKRTIEQRWPDAYRFAPVQNGMGSPALDVFYSIRGWFVAIETKAPGKKPTPRQQQTIKEIIASGGMAFVIDSEESLRSAIFIIETRCQS